MTTVTELFAAAGTSGVPAVAWGERASLDRAGLYVISTSEDPDDQSGPPTCPLDDAAIATLLAARPELTVDGRRPDLDELRGRLAALWPAGETVVYVGMASQSVAHRVGQFVSTEIGARAPHSGGWPLKMIDARQPLFVHVALHDDPVQGEKDVIEAFMVGIRPTVAAALVDPTVPLPFANLEVPGGCRKNHGIRGARQPNGGRRATTPVAAATTGRPEWIRPSRPNDGRTQRVTAADLDGGRIRIPGDSKRHFPGHRSQVSIEVRGHRADVRWDPKNGPDKNRSGVLSIGKALRALVRPDEHLAIWKDQDVFVIG